jgi:hypothetical protein
MALVLGRCTVRPGWQRAPWYYEEQYRLLNEEQFLENRISIVPTSTTTHNQMFTTNSALKLIIKIEIKVY